MENEIIMNMNEVNEEVIDEVVVPAVETAEAYCSHSGKSKFMPILGAAALIGVIAAGVVIYRRRLMSKGKESEAQVTDVTPNSFDFDDEENDDDEKKDD